MVEPNKDTRKQTPLRMDPDLYVRLEVRAAEQHKSVNALICEVLEQFFLGDPTGVSLSQIRLKVRHAIDEQVRINGWSLQAVDVQRAIYLAFGIAPE